MHVHPHPSPRPPARSRRTTRATALAAGLTLSLALGACSSSGSTARPAESTVADAASSTTAPSGGAVAVSNARIPVPAKPDVAAIYLDIVNDTDAADTLESVETNAGGTAELHLTETVDGVTSMHEVPSVEVPAGGTLSLRPGSYHIMIMDPTAPLALGDDIEVTLHFAKAGDLTVHATVVDPATVGGGMGMGGHDASGDHGSSDDAPSGEHGAADAGSMTGGY